MGSYHIQQGSKKRDTLHTVKGSTVVTVPGVRDNLRLNWLRTTIKTIRSGGTLVRKRAALVGALMQKAGDRKQITSYKKVDDLFLETEELFFIVVRTFTTIQGILHVAGICTVSNTTGLGLNPSLCSTVWVQEGLTPLGNCGNMNTHLLMNTGKSMEVYVEVQIEVLAMPMVLEEDGHSLMLGHSNTVSRHFIHA